MRHIVGTAYPGRQLQDLSPVEAFSAFMIRALGRHEPAARAGMHVSDGSLLNELAYLRGRIEVGAFGAASRISDAGFSRLVDLFEQHVQRCLMPSRHCLFAHIEPELPLDNDGYRPQDTAFRDFVNDFLLASYRKLKLNAISISGSLAERTALIESILNEHHVLQNT